MDLYKKNKKIIWAFILLILAWPGQAILAFPFSNIILPLFALVLLNQAKTEGGNKKIISIGNIIAGVLIAILITFFIGLLLSYLSGDKMQFLV